MTPSPHPLTSQDLPIFISSPGGPDYLMIVMASFLIAFVLAIGILYLRLHALPDHIAHKSQKMQDEIVCVLGLLAMFTHIHAFWIAGLFAGPDRSPRLQHPVETHVRGARQDRR